MANVGTLILQHGYSKSAPEVEALLRWKHTTIDTKTNDTFLLDFPKKTQRNDNDEDDD